jgi:hypothetical protein
MAPSLRAAAAIGADQRNPLIKYFENRPRRRRYPGFEESACEPIARADTSISKRYLFSLAGWIIGLPQAGRPSGGLATFTIEKGIQT